MQLRFLVSDILGFEQVPGACVACEPTSKLANEDS